MRYFFIFFTREAVDEGVSRVTQRLEELHNQAKLPGVVESSLVVDSTNGQTFGIKISEQTAMALPKITTEFLGEWIDD